MQNKKIKRFLIFTALVIIAILLYLVFNDYKDNTKYTLNDLYELLNKTDHIVNCKNLETEPNKICDEGDIGSVVNDQEKIREIISLITRSKEDKSKSIKAVLTPKSYFVDASGNILLYGEINPNLIIGKDNDSYVLTTENVERITQLLFKKN